METERFKKQVDFILEADKEKTIYRQTHITDYARQENDAEHAWHMAMMIYLLKEYANEDFNVAKAMMMALIHDIVEIDAGDTYAYDEVALATQKEREDKAAERIFGLLPSDQAEELKSLFYEFEAGESAEAKFAKVMDNFQPLLLNDLNGGKDWRVHSAKKSKVIKRQDKSKEGSEFIWRHTRELIEDNVRKGNIVDDI